MSLAIQVWIYECCSNVPPKIASKVIFKNIEPTKKELAKLQIPRKDVIQHERSVDSDDDFQDPPLRKINEHSKKKQKVRRKFKGIRGLMRKKFKKMKKAFAQSKNQVVDIEADKPNVDEGGLEKSGQHFSPDVVQSSNNISDGTKQQHADKDPVLQNMDYVGTERSPQRLSLEVDQELEANLLGKKTSDEKIDETILFDSQFTIPDEMKEKVDQCKRGKSEISKMHFGVETVVDKNWFYMMGFADQTWTDSHIDVCLCYLRKKSKYGPHKCLSYGHKVIATEFDPNALRTRYAALLWDYGIRKQEANAISDVEAPLRPARSSWRSFEFWRQYYFITYVLWNYSVISVWQRVD
ncbi:hypothetical protein FXO38_36736 [Capsicum annuum]|nr:hypothetical protein FXO38_36736 [Capsicum annuum]KAF3685091.1 hypothetical protein FXO37_00979 [Capsicum annuum]